MSMRSTMRGARDKSGSCDPAEVPRASRPLGRGHPAQKREPNEIGPLLWERGDRKAEGAPRFAGCGGEGFLHRIPTGCDLKSEASAIGLSCSKKPLIRPRTSATFSPGEKAMFLVHLRFRSVQILKLVIMGILPARSQGERGIPPGSSAFNSLKASARTIPPLC